MNDVLRVCASTLQHNQKESHSWQFEHRGVDGTTYEQEKKEKKIDEKKSGVNSWVRYNYRANELLNGCFNEYTLTI